MDKKALIEDLENSTAGYHVVVGVDGYNSLSEVEMYFMEYYRAEYTKKLTLIIMLLISWFDTEYLFETDDEILAKKYKKFSNKVSKIESSEDVRTLVELISESMSDNDSRIRFLFTDNENKEFVMYIYADVTIGFSELSDETKDYIEKQLDKQGLSLYPD